MASVSPNIDKVAATPSRVTTVAKLPLVLVTGATGFVGSWAVSTLLAAGYRVRGTARALKTKKCRLLRALPGAEGRLELVQADLMQPVVDWVRVASGCDYVMHIASPVIITDNADEVIKPAVQGTVSVLQAANRAGTVKRVVLTSSVAAIMYGHGSISIKTWTEADFSDPDGPDMEHYVKSKILAEQEAWKIARGEGAYAADGPAKFDLVTIHPGFITGPVLGDIGSFTSMTLLEQMMAGNSMVDGGFPFVDVRDVARAHLLALATPQASNRRFLATHSAASLLDMQKVLAAEFNDKGYSVSTGLTPTWLINCLACCIKDAAVAQSMIGHFPKVDATTTEKVLGLRLSHGLDSLTDMARAAIQHGYIADKSEGKALSSVDPSLQQPHVDGLAIQLAEKADSAGEATGQSEGR